MAQLIKTNGEIIDIEPINGTDFRLKELQEYVGGLIEVVYMNHRRIMICNEEGRLESLSVNHVASQILANDLKRDVIAIVGDVVICEDHQLK